MGAAGSDVALETADVALMADDSAQLPFAVGLSRHTRGPSSARTSSSALGVVAFLVPATIFGLGIGPAVAMHEGSTLLSCSTRFGCSATAMRSFHPSSSQAFSALV
jgi:Cd2+/Zn2+-exporting ATPase